MCFEYRDLPCFDRSNLEVQMRRRSVSVPRPKPAKRSSTPKAERPKPVWDVSRVNLFP